MAPRSLDTYRRKRDPARTPEPFAATPTRLAGAQRFVVQQHAARRLHWDFRLEIEGVLVSWAVPRGPSVDPKEKRLAVHTEDHPLEYGDFEGSIPAGNYGAGAVILWDNGTYRTVDDEPPAQGLAAGKLDFLLHGHKLHGRWALVRTKRGEGKEWLLFKKADGVPTRPEPVDAQPASVVSGLTVLELRDGLRRDSALAALAAGAGAPRRDLPATALAPMLADTAEQPFDRPGWIFELKYDGVRLLIVRQHGDAPRLLLRSGRDATATFPEIARAAAHLPIDDCVIDGELITRDGRGSGSFEQLQTRLGLSNPWDVARAAAAVPVQVLGFDLLAVAGHDLRGVPLVTRKAILQRLLPAQGAVRFADHIADRGLAFYEAAREHDVEGIVAKRADSRYASGRRSREWLKIKAPRTADLAIVGFVPGKGSRAALGALMLAWRRDDGFVYAGNIGSGLSPRLVDALLPALRASQRSTPAFSFADPLARGAVFIEPTLVAEVRYNEATERGLLRQPVFLRIREDKTVLECDAVPRGRRSFRVSRSALRVEEPESAGNQAAGPTSSAPSERTTHNAERTTSPFKPTNTAKIFWPGEGYTKGDLLTYYERAWPWLEPYLRDRPLVLTRYPDGIAGKSFFQKNAPDFLPDWVPTVRVDDAELFVCNQLESLLYLVNLGSIPLHMWSARAASIEHPDWSILDLDPKDAPFRDVLAVARHIHALLAPLGAPHFIKTSGQAGLHVLIPLDGRLTHEEATAFAEVLARLVVADLPDIATIVRPLGGRAGKVYVDYLQNGRGKTIAAPFAVRPQPGAPVSTPLEWREVTARLNPARFTIATVPPRLTRRGDPMHALFDAPVDVEAVLTELGQRLGR